MTNKEYRLTDGLYCSEIDDQHIPELEKDLEEYDELLGLIHEPERGVVKCLISTASFAPNLRYIQ